MTMQGQEYAVFTEFSPDNKMMIPGFNTRVFTDVDSQRGDSIRCNFKTGATGWCLTYFSPQRASSQRDK